MKKKVREIESHCLDWVSKVHKLVGKGLEYVAGNNECLINRLSIILEGIENRFKLIDLPATFSVSNSDLKWQLPIFSCFLLYSVPYL